MSWSNERVTLLKKLWGEGRSAAEIAKILGDGITRNAVIGKAHRLQLAARIAPSQQNTKKVEPRTHVARTESAPLARAKPARMGRPAMPPPVIIRKGGIPMIELREGMCRWPYGDPKEPDFQFCGCASIPGLPYCEDHARVAYHVPARGRTITVQDYDARGTTADADDEADEVKVASTLRR